MTQKGTLMTMNRPIINHTDRQEAPFTMAGMTSRQTQSRLVDLLFFSLGSLYLIGITAVLVYVISKMINYFYN